MQRRSSTRASSPSAARLGRARSRKTALPAAISFALLATAGASPAAGSNSACTFVGPSGTHWVTYHRGLSCEEAKDVLRDLRGRHAFVPQACAGPRTINGWRLTNMQRKWTTVATRYTKGRLEIHYVRHQTYDNPSCPGIGPKDLQGE